MDFSSDNILVTADADKKKKGKDGTNAVLSLMQGLRNFQEEIEVCLEAQEDPENRAELEKLDGQMDAMYETLLGLASSGIKSIRKRDVVEEVSNAKSPPPTLMSPTIPAIPSM